MRLCRGSSSSRPRRGSSASCRRSSSTWRRPRSTRSRRGTSTRAAASAWSSGDITAPGLGIEAKRARELHRSLKQAWHLAAVYDLAVRRDVGRRINVEGTKNVLEFVGDAPQFERLQYVSTAYVSGTAPRHLPRDRPRRRPGLQEPLRGDEVPGRGGGRPLAAAPHDLPPGRGGRRLEDGRDRQVRRPLPRAAADGEAALARASSSGSAWASAPSTSCPSTSWSRRWPRSRPARSSVGKTYHLCDPQPHSPGELAEMFAEAIGKSFVYLPVPMAVAKAFFSPKPVQRFFGMPLEALDYFDDPVRHDTTQATQRPRRARHRVPAARRLHAAARGLLPSRTARACAGRRWSERPDRSGCVRAVEGAYDFDESLRFLPFGPYDPTCQPRARRAVAGAARTPDGPVTLQLVRTADGMSRPRAWGRGRRRGRSRGPARSLGLDDDPAGFAPDRSAARAARPALPRRPPAAQPVRARRPRPSTSSSSAVSFRDAVRAHRRPRRGRRRAAAPGPPGLLLPLAAGGLAGGSRDDELRRGRHRRPARVAPCAPRRATPAARRVGLRPAPDAARARAARRWPGCGPWTVEITMGFVLGDPDAVPDRRPAPAARGLLGARRRAAGQTTHACSSCSSRAAASRFRVLRLLLAAGRLHLARPAGATGRPAPATGAAAGRAPGGRRSAGAAGRSWAAPG